MPREELIQTANTWLSFTDYVMSYDHYDIPTQIEVMDKRLNKWIGSNT